MRLVRQLLPFASLLLILIALAVLVPDKFLTADNFLNIFRRSSVNAIIAAGMTAIIISGGHNIYASDLEAVLRRHPAVREAAVVGVHDAGRVRDA